MDSLISDLLKIVLGAVLTMCAQWVYANLNTKKEKNKLRRQKLEEAFIIVGDILGGDTLQSSFVNKSKFKYRKSKI